MANGGSVGAIEAIEGEAVTVACGEDVGAGAGVRVCGGAVGLDWQAATSNASTIPAARIDP
jgi:hypothetical protein